LTVLSEPILKQKAANLVAEYGPPKQKAQMIWVYD